MVREVAILNIKYTPHLFEYCSLSNLWWGRGNAGSSPPHSAPPPPRVANTQHSGDLSLSVPGSPTSEGWSPTGEEPASNGARRASWAELGGARQDGEELGGLKKWRGQFHTEKSGMGVGEHDKVEGRFRRSY